MELDWEEAPVLHETPVLVGELVLVELEQLVPDLHDVAEQRLVHSAQLMAPVTDCMLKSLQIQLHDVVV